MRRPSAGAARPPLLLAAVGVLSLPATAAASLLRTRSRAAPTICVNHPSSWADSRGYACADYVSGRYCTSAGAQGPGWIPLWGDFGSYAAQGTSADAACCACGGGKQEPIPTCSSFQCPAGYMTKAGADGQYCTNLSCDSEADRSACCDQSPDVQLEVDKIQVKIGQLEQKVANDIAAGGEKEAESVSTMAGNFGAKLGEQLKADLDAKRQTAIGDASAWFSKKAGGGGSLSQAAEHELTAVGYMAAKSSAESGVGQTNKAALESSAKRVQDAFQQALASWQAAGAVGSAATSQGFQEWQSYYDDLNSTWPKIEAGINAANGAVDASAEPGQAVRWSKEVTRLATDLAQLTNTHAESLAAQVTAAMNSAKQANTATQSNAGKIGALETLVEQASLNQQAGALR